MKPMDIVKDRTTGQLMLVCHVTERNTASVESIGDSRSSLLKTAWWNEDEVEYIDNVYNVMARGLTGTQMKYDRRFDI